MSSYTRINPQPIVKELDLGTITLPAGGRGYKSGTAETVSGYRVAGTLGARWTHPGTVSCSPYSWGASIFIHLKNNGDQVMEENVLRVYVLYLPDNVT